MKLKKTAQGEKKVQEEKVKKQDKRDEKILELTNDLQRTRADFENYRKQVELQRAQAVEITREETVKEVLGLLDNLKLAIINYPEQLAPVQKTLEKTLADLGLEEIVAKAGVEFDPDFHEAVMVDESEGEKEIIVEVLRPGYLYKGKILRPAMVKVGRE